jgi:hypothetical protein
VLISPQFGGNSIVISGDTGPGSIKGDVKSKHFS